jgi:hypothetical protein
VLALTRAAALVYVVARTFPHIKMTARRVEEPNTSVWLTCRLARYAPKRGKLATGVDAIT